MELAVDLPKHLRRQQTMKIGNSMPAPLQLTVLSESEMGQIHWAALEVLRRTGVEFQHQGALDVLKEAGALVSDGNRVRFPPAMVEDAISSGPSRIVMCDRDGDAAMFLEGTRSYFGSGSDTLNILDPQTGEHRRFRRSDLVDAYRLCDALPNIDFVMSIGIPSDVDVQLQYDTQLAMMLEHTRKPIVFVTNDGASCQRAIDMAAAAAGSHEALAERPQILLYSEPSSPLTQSETALEKLMLMASYRLPILHSPAVLMGATGPVTLAGGLVQAVAEVLSGLVLHQLTRRGAPFAFGAAVPQLDMRAMVASYVSPEFQLNNIAMAQLGRWYGMPTWGTAGCSDSQVVDEQAALEAMLGILIARLSGANLIHDAGYFQSGLSTSFELVVLADELVAMTDQLMRGIEVNDDTMLVAEIDEVGPGGDFIRTKETVSRFRDYWFPSLISRMTRERWLEAGGTTLGERLNIRVKEIISQHRPTPLDPGKRRKIQEILVSAQH
jgi:trimethylamine--corrinoid protein Co-methyltransferase